MLFGIATVIVGTTIEAELLEYAECLEITRALLATITMDTSHRLGILLVVLPTGCQVV